MAHLLKIFSDQDHNTEVLEDEEDTTENLKAENSEIIDVDKNMFQRCVVNEGIMCEEKTVCTKVPSEAVIYSED